jgi:hypothetical protein
MVKEYKGLISTRDDVITISTSLQVGGERAMTEVIAGYMRKGLENFGFVKGTSKNPDYENWTSKKIDVSPTEYQEIKEIDDEQPKGKRSYTIRKEEDGTLKLLKIATIGYKDRETEEVKPSETLWESEEEIVDNFSTYGKVFLYSNPTENKESLIVSITPKTDSDQETIAKFLKYGFTDQTDSYTQQGRIKLGKWFSVSFVDKELLESLRETPNAFGKINFITSSYVGIKQIISIEPYTPNQNTNTNSEDNNESEDGDDNEETKPKAKKENVPNIEIDDEDIPF